MKILLSGCPLTDLPATMAFQSIKKGLPDSCKCMESALLEGLIKNVTSGSPPVLPRGYIPFVKKVVSRLFPKGWDSDYEGYCCRTAPPIKGTLERGRSALGCLGDLTAKEDFGQAEFLEVVLHGREYHRPLTRLKGAFNVVQSAGKPRPLTSFHSDGLFLKPLHKTMYNRLSKQKWLSRGDVTAASLHKAGFRRGLGPLSSGDYTSATDNLSIEVMETCVAVMMENACCVPPNIRDFALRACRPLIHPNLEDYRASLLVFAVGDREDPARDDNPDFLSLKKGQMMGSFLSFPLLCLQNYLAFAWSTRKCQFKIPVIINGDDILFQAPSGVHEVWADCVSSIGLIVEPTKTSLSDLFGTLNSTLFGWDSAGKLRLIPTFRFGMLRPAEFPHSLGRSFADFLVGFSGRLRWLGACVFFEAHVAELRKTCFTLPALGFRGSLALRLARIFGLMDDVRLDSDPPTPPQTHSVCLPQDLITEVPCEFVDGELRNLNSIETAAWKWQRGCRDEGVQVHSGIAYAIKSTRWTDDADVVSCLLSAMTVSDTGFEYRWGQAVRCGRLTHGTAPTRLALSKPFFSELSRRETCRVFYRVAEECLRRAAWFWGPLPNYEEACGAVCGDGAAQGGELG